MTSLEQRLAHEIAAVTDGVVLTESELQEARSAVRARVRRSHRERLRREPGLLSRAVPELLRFTSSVPVGAPMYATEDLEFAGVQIQRGEAVIPGLLSANFDPREYSESALDLDVGRELGSGVGHMALGHGPHYCIGATLATVEAEVLVDRMFLRGDGPRLAVARDELEFVARPGDGIHLKALPVRF